MQSEEDLKKEREKDNDIDAMKMSDITVDKNDSDSQVEPKVLNGDLMMGTTMSISQNTQNYNSSDQEYIMNEDNNMDIDADKSFIDNTNMMESDEDGEGDDEDGGDGIPSAPNKKSDKTKWSEEEVDDTNL